jgi:hypothetical protein
MRAEVRLLAADEAVAVACTLAQKSVVTPSTYCEGRCGDSKHPSNLGGYALSEKRVLEVPTLSHNQKVLPLAMFPASTPAIPTSSPVPTAGAPPDAAAHNSRSHHLVCRAAQVHPRIRPPR